MPIFPDLLISALKIISLIKRENSPGYGKGKEAKRGRGRSKGRGREMDRV